MFIPVLVLLLVGAVQLGKITYTYYALKKTLYAAAHYLASQQGVNFCDEGDTAIAVAKSFALTGAPGAEAQPRIVGLTAEQISIEMECYDSGTQSLGQCSIEGCGTVAGGPTPDSIVVSIPNGYPVQPRIPGLTLDPVQLRPTVRIPFGGT